MLTSSSTGELLAAILKAKAQFQPILKTEKVRVSTKTGCAYDFNYAPLDVIQAATEAALSAEGLLLVSGVSPRPDGTVDVVTRLMHAASEQWLESRIPSGALEDVKALGGFVSYARRYNTLALLDLSAEDDLDGSQATGDHIEPRSKTVSHLPSTNGASATHLPQPAETMEHPTEGHLAALRNLAVTECQEPVDVYEDRLRTTMKIPKQASVAPKLLTRTMTMQAYMEVFAYYRRLEAQLAKGKEASRGAQPAAEESAAPEPAPAPTGEDVPVDPHREASAAASSSSATDPAAEAAERDRQRLRQEIASWPLRVSEQEVEHILTHHPYSKARALLWKARLQPSGEALVAD